MYVSYEAALEMWGLQPLHMRREHRSLQFVAKCINHPINKEMFPLNPTQDTHEIRNREQFKVNKANTEYYRKSIIPYLQRRLNDHFMKKDSKWVISSKGISGPMMIAIYCSSCAIDH